MRSTLVFTLVIVSAVLLGTAHAGYLTPKALSRECPNPRGGHYLQPEGSDLCNECCERCYAMHFDATVVNAGVTNTNYCNVNGTSCPVWVFFRVSPCCECEDDEESITQDICYNHTRTSISQTESKCQIKNLTVLVGPNQVPTYDLFECDPDCDYLNKYSWKSESKDEEYTVLVMGTCGTGPGGAGIQMIFDKYHPGPRFPDLCFMSNHFRSWANTSCEGPFSSSLIVDGPSCPSEQWLVANFSNHAPLPMPCGRWERLQEDQCHESADNAQQAISEYAVKQVNAPSSNNKKNPANNAADLIDDSSETSDEQARSVSPDGAPFKARSVKTHLKHKKH